MPTRTARGTAQAKASGTTLSTASFTWPADHSGTVGVACENSQGPPTSVTINGRPLKRRQNQNNAAGSLNLSVWFKAAAAKDQTGVVTATWSSAIAARTLVVTTYDERQRIDQTASALDTPTTTPGTGLTAGLRPVEGFAVCYFASRGPLGDTAATGATIDDLGSPATAGIGQRAGTTGAGALTNVTIQETYLALTAPTLTVFQKGKIRLTVPQPAEVTQGALSGVTQRRWANAILALRSPEDNTSFAFSDLRRAQDQFNTENIDLDQMIIYKNLDEDRWEVYDRGASIENSDTRRRYFDIVTGAWVEDA